VIAFVRHHRQADAVAGDRIAEGDVVEAEAAGFDMQAKARFAAGEMGDAADRGNDSENMGDTVSTKIQLYHAPLIARLAGMPGW